MLPLMLRIKSKDFQNVIKIQQSTVILDGNVEFIFLETRTGSLRAV
jgi:hypothetical protein